MKYPNFYIEKKLWQKGFRYIAGVDEVGRGCFAGPVVAAAVAFDSKNQNYKLEVKIDDSKKLTAKQRERSAALKDIMAEMANTAKTNADGAKAANAIPKISCVTWQS